MLGERVNAEMQPQGGEPREIPTRVDGIENEEIRTAVRERVAEILTHPRDVAAGATTGGGVEPQDEEDAIGVALAGFTADQQRQRELRAAVRASVIEELGAAEASTRRSAMADFCVCASGVPGNRLAFSEIPWWDENGAWIPEPDGFDNYVVAMWIDPWNPIQLKVFNGAASDPPVSKDQVDVGLRAVTDWPKEIWADNLCFGRAAAVYHPGNSQRTTMYRLPLDKAVCWEGADTIVFRKPGFWGIWHDVAHFAPEQFWQAFGGTKINFVWISD